MQIRNYTHSYPPPGICTRRAHSPSQALSHLWHIPAAAAHHPQAASRTEEFGTNAGSHINSSHPTHPPARHRTHIKPTLHTVPSLQPIPHTQACPHISFAQRPEHNKHNLFTTLHLFQKPVQPTTSGLHPSPPQLQEEASRSVCSGHSGQELKCSKEEPGASAPRLQERTALAVAAAAAPPARSRGASERSSRCSEPSSASLARLLPKFARGPRRAGPPREEHSRRLRHCHRHRGLGVSRGRPAHGAASFDQQRVQISPREVLLGLRSSQLLAPTEEKRQGTA